MSPNLITLSNFLIIFTYRQAVLDPTKALVSNGASIYPNSESFFATQVLLFALILSYKQNSIKKALPALLIAGAMSYIENMSLAPEDADFSFSFFKYGMCALMGAESAF